MRDQRTTLGRREWVRLGVASTLLAACADESEPAAGGARDGSLDAAVPGKLDASAARDAAPRDATLDAAPAALDRGWGDNVMRAADLIDFHASFLATPDWSLDAQLRLMDQAGITISLLSFGGDSAGGASANDQAAALVARAPERLRFYASLPLSDVAAARDEWQRSRTKPGCIGAVVRTNTDGVYPGAAALDPLWQALNEAKALVLLQAAPPPSWSAIADGEPVSTTELYFEVVRALMSMFEGQVLSRYPDLRVIVPYCGGALPIVLDRVRTFGLAGYTIDPFTTNSQLERLWFDCAGTPLPTQLPALLAQTSIDRVVYGSDSGHAAVESIYAQVVSLEQTVSPSDPSWRDTLVKNGRRALTR